MKAASEMASFLFLYELQGYKWSLKGSVASYHASVLLIQLSIYSLRNRRLTPSIRTSHGVRAGAN